MQELNTKAAAKKRCPKSNFSGPNLNCSSYPTSRVEKYKPNYYSDHKQIMKNTATTSTQLLLPSMLFWYLAREKPRTDLQCFDKTFFSIRKLWLWRRKYYQKTSHQHAVIQYQNISEPNAYGFPLAWKGQIDHPKTQKYVHFLLVFRTTITVTGTAATW